MFADKHSDYNKLFEKKQSIQIIIYKNVHNKSGDEMERYMIRHFDETKCIDEENYDNKEEALEHFFRLKKENGVIEEVYNTDPFKVKGITYVFVKEKYFPENSDTLLFSSLEESNENRLN